MLNKIFQSAKATKEEDSLGSGDEYVLLEAEEPREEEEASNETSEEAQTMTEPTREDLIEEASSLLLNEVVDEPDVESGAAEASKEPEEKAAASDVEDERKEGEEKALIPDDTAEEPTPKKDNNYSSNGPHLANMEDARSDDDTKPEEEPAQKGARETEEKEDSEEFYDPENADEDAKDDKENSNPEKGADGSDEDKDFKFGTRGQVNGSAAIFGVAGLVVGGPVAGVLSAVAAAHIAANKPCKCADLTRNVGNVVDNFGKKKRLARAAKRKAEGGAPKPHIWDKITDKLVEGGEFTEKVIIPRRRRAPVKKAADE